ncbi:MAG: protein kinase domain-containing protein [Gemmatimonadota bacterium]
MPEPLPPPPPDNDLRNHVEGVLSDGYELDREIGRGGMGIVYLARDRRLKRAIAIKILPPELAFRSEIRTRFLREAETAAGLSHPNIVPIYSVHERDGLVFFVMAYVDGENLAVRLHRAGPMSNDEVRRVLIETARALAYAHARGVVHRDIKPDNILLERTDGRVMVTDFGIARAITEGSDARLTATGMAIGTPAYMSPEQSTGEREVDGRSDLYSLGIVGYQMITGELPFNANSTPALLVKHLSEAPPQIEERCPTVEPDIAQSLMILLEKNPENRFASAIALVDALETRRVPHHRSSNVTRARREAASVRRPQALAETHAEDTDRWNHADVVAFRRKVGPWAFWGGVSILLSVFGVIDIVGVWGLYTVYIAWKYAQLWTNGHDWRDVLREPPDRMFLDVLAEWADNVRAIWDPHKRAEVRERRRLRGNRRFLADSGPAASLSRNRDPKHLPKAALAGRYQDTVRGAVRNRDEIAQLLTNLPRHERELLGDVKTSAAELCRRVESLAVALDDIEGGLPEQSAEEIDSEIGRLEAAANPLDTEGSDQRVRRLAQLKRQRRSIAALADKVTGHRERMESCALALENMRLDLLRLRAGAQTYDHITSVAEKAVALAREVDTAMYVRDEMSKLNRRSTGSART